jgi:hypothetical protein
MFSDEGRTLAHSCATWRRLGVGPAKLAALAKNANTGATSPSR